MTHTSVGAHDFEVLTSFDDEVGIDLVAELLPTKYVDSEILAQIAERLEKPQVAAYLRDQFPVAPNLRSGDIGEILGTAYVQEELGYVVGPSRFIQRDHQNWAMRGDDILGAKLLPDSTLQIVKGEAKSGASIGAQVVTEARAALDTYGGLPSPHSLSHFAMRLLKSSSESLGHAIIQVLYSTGMRPGSVTHVMFLFSGNDPSAEVQQDLHTYRGAIKQIARIIKPIGHQRFVSESYERAINNAS
jgi:hypothetical protein